MIESFPSPDYETPETLRIEDLTFEQLREVHELAKKTIKENPDGRFEMINGNKMYVEDAGNHYRICNTGHIRNWMSFKDGQPVLTFKSKDAAIEFLRKSLRRKGYRIVKR